MTKKFKKAAAKTLAGLCIAGACSSFACDNTQAFTEYKTGLKLALDNSADSYNAEYDVNRDGALTFSDIACIMSQIGVVGGQKSDFSGIYCNSDRGVLDVKREADKVIVKVNFAEDDIKNLKGGFDFAVKYDNKTLKFDKFEWSQEFIEAFQPVLDDDSWVLRNAYSIYDYKVNDSYIGMAGIYHEYAIEDKYEPVVKEIATITFSVVDDSENVEQGISLGLMGTEKESGKVMDKTVYPSDYVKNCIMGSVGQKWKVTLSDVNEVLKGALGISDLSNYQEFSYDVDGDGKVNLNDVADVLKMALGITDIVNTKSLESAEGNIHAFISEKNDKTSDNMQIIENYEQLEAYLSDYPDEKKANILKAYKDSFEQYNILAVKEEVNCDDIANIDSCTVINGSNIMEETTLNPTYTNGEYEFNKFCVVSKEMTDDSVKFILNKSSIDTSEN